MPDAAAWAAWLTAFALTQVIEAPIFAAALRRDAEPQRSWPRALGWGLLPSALTHPFVWFAFPVWMAGAQYEVMVAAAELFAVLVEAAVLRALGCKRALLWSLFANAVSVGIGFLLRYTTGWV